MVFHTRLKSYHTNKWFFSETFHIPEYSKTIFSIHSQLIYIFSLVPVSTPYKTNKSRWIRTLPNTEPRVEFEMRRRKVVHYCIAMIRKTCSYNKAASLVENPLYVFRWNWYEFLFCMGFAVFVNIACYHRSIELYVYVHPFQCGNHIQYWIFRHLLFGFGVHLLNFPYYIVIFNFLDIVLRIRLF